MTQEHLLHAVVDLSRSGGRITVLRVAQASQQPAEQVEAGLDALAREGKLDLELDEDSGELFYVPVVEPSPTSTASPQGAARRPQPTPLWVTRALQPSPSQPSASQSSARSWVSPRSRGRHLVKHRRKSVAIAALLGLIPGVGLFYAAPLGSAIAWTVLMWVGLELLAAVPLFGAGLAGLAWPALVIASAILGAKYASRFNEMGRRARLEPRRDALDFGTGKPAALRR